MLSVRQLVFARTAEMRANTVTFPPWAARLFLSSFAQSLCILRRGEDAGVITWEKPQEGLSPPLGALCMCIRIWTTSDWPVFKTYLSADSSQIYLSISPMGLCTHLSGRLLLL